MLSAVADSVTQLQLDVAKISARVVAIDSEVASIARRLNGESGPDTVDDSGGRDLALEQAVFANFRARPVAEIDRTAKRKSRETASVKSGKRSSARRSPKRKR